MPSDDLLFLGVDGGQSSTTALIGDGSGRVLGFGQGGPCNHVSGPEAQSRFRTAVAVCVTQALRGAGLPETWRSFHSACFGFSGGPADKKQIIEEMFHFDRFEVTHDALIALSGATAGGPGVIVIAGTGSIAFGRAADGTIARAGGWGYTFGDEGGAFDITRRALRAALSLEEGWGPQTSLRSLLLEATGATSSNGLLHRFYTPEFPRPRIASFARLVDQAALAGDPVAVEILNQSAQQLAVLAAAVRRQLFSETGTARVSFLGGVFRSDLLREKFRILVELTGGNSVQPPRMGPAAGALLESYRLAGVSVTLSNVPESEK